MSDAERIASLAQRGAFVELSPTELCFVAFLHLRSQAGRVTAFSEPELVDGFEQASKAVDPATENLRTRANHAIRRLREQRMLVRVDGAGVRRAGEFALTRLATGIAEFFIEEEVLTRESLTILTASLVSKLDELRGVAARAGSPQEWKHAVEDPLRITVSDLVRGIERRQRGLDIQQEEFQREVARLLGSDWFGALDRCEKLLDETANTLRELNAILLRGSHELCALLLDLRELAMLHHADSVQVVLERLIDQVDRITAWGSARQRAWSEYYEYVHGYLRDVVRLDPSRALTQRLREQLLSHTGRPFALVVAAEPAYRQLRTVRPVVPPPPVRRPKADRERDPEAEPERPDPLAEVEARVREQLERGVRDLSEITARLTEQTPAEEHFLLAGRIAAVLANLRRPLPEWERPWIRIGQNLAIEQWRLPEQH